MKELKKILVGILTVFPFWCLGAFTLKCVDPEIPNGIMTLLGFFVGVAYGMCGAVFYGVGDIVIQKLERNK